MLSQDVVAWSEWMRAAGMSEATIRTRTTQVETLCHRSNVADPKQLTTRQVVTWLSECDAAWTRRTYWCSARAWFRWLVDMDDLDTSPMAKIPRPRVARGRPRPVPDAVIIRLLHDPPGVRAYAYVALAVLAGLRVHEIAKMAGEDVDLEQQWLYVNGKGGKVAGLPAHPAVIRLAWGLPRSGYWFPGNDGGHVHAQSVSQVIRNALRAQGSKAAPHHLRHSFGTQVLRGSRDSRLAQELLRHESADSTAVYTEVAYSDMRAAIRGLPWSA